MGMRIFMIITYLLVPLLMIGFGRLWLHRPPKNINVIYGYRSTRSMASKEAWDFAHRYIGRIWACSGWALLVVTGIFLWMYPDMESAYGEYMVFMGLQLVAMIAGIPATEKALKERFPK